MSGGWTVNSTGWWKFDSRISALEKLVQLQKHYPTMRHIIVVYHKLKTKPRGAKVGTWAWACEQMLARKWVKRGGMMRSYALAQMGGVTQLCARSATNTGPFLPHAPTEFEMLSLDWQVCS